MSPRPHFLVAGAAALALLFAACGGDDGGGRPSAAELSSTFEEAGLDPDVASCVGDAYAGSDLSDGALRQIADADLSEGVDTSSLPDIEVSDDDQAAGEAVGEAVTACITDGIDLPADPTATTEAEG